jgi:hypothetical protein
MPCGLALRVSSRCVSPSPVPVRCFYSPLFRSFLLTTTWVRYVQDVATILISSLGRLVPSSLSPSRLFGRRRQGYGQLSISANGDGGAYGSGGRGERGRTEEREDENRLIDQLDEEWDD